MDYRNIELKFERAVVHHLKPIPQKVPFMDATSGPFLYTKVDYLLELYDSDGAVGKMPCTPVMMERIWRSRAFFVSVACLLKGYWTLISPGEGNCLRNVKLMVFISFLL